VRRLGQVLFFVLASCSWMACTEGDDPRPVADAGELPTVVRKLVGSAGGTLQAKGVSLDIPAGALDKDVMILAKVSEDVADVPATVKRESELVEFGPAGTKFKKDVTVTFTLTKQEPRAVVYFTKEDSEDEFEPLGSSKNKNLEVTATVKHFSRGFAGVPDDEPVVDGGDQDAGEVEDAGADARVDAGIEAGSDPGVDAAEPDTGSVDAGLTDTGAQDAEEPADADSGPVDAGPQFRTITLNSRDQWGNPTNQTWVAFQDDTNGPWQVASPSSVGTYRFSVAGDRYSVVAVCANTTNTSSRAVMVYALATSSTQEVSASYCASSPTTTTYTLSGRIDAPGGASILRYGHPFAIGQAPITNDDAGVPTYSIPGFLAGATVDTALAVANGATLLRGRVLRGVTLTNDSTLLLDMATQGSPVGNAQLIVNNSSLNAYTYIDAYFVTGGADRGLSLEQGSPWSEGDGVYHLDFATLDVAETISTDRYRFVATEIDFNGAAREIEYRTQNPVNVALAFPDAFTATLGADTAPYLRPSVSFNIVADARAYHLNAQYTNQAQSRLLEAHIDADYLPNMTTHSFLYPDLSGVQGFDAAWMPPSAGPVNINGGVTVEGTLNGGELRQVSETSVTFPPLQPG
jgi:hypothetical protein